MINNICIYTTFLCAMDSILSNLNIEGRYYFNHCFINFMIMLSSINDVVYCYTNFNNAINVKTNTEIIEYVFAIHFYHIIYYNYKFRFDDWLHHILMVFVSLPLALNLKNGAILSHTFFFITGLPGCIDYFLLFLNRNKLIDKHIEKYTNYILNLWIRCPGCIASSNLILMYYGQNYHKFDILSAFSLLLIMFTIFWNGVYFMKDIVINYTINYNNKYKKN